MKIMHILYGFCPGQPRWAGTRRNIHPLTLIMVSIARYLLHPQIRSMASSLFDSHAWQSFSTISLKVFFGLRLGWAPSTSYSIHFFTQSLSSFHSTCPYHCNMFCWSTEIMSSNPSLSTLYLELCLNSLTPHIHLTILISTCWSATSFPFLWAKSYFHATTTLHTTVVLSPSHCQWYILIGKQWYQLPEFIPSYSASPSTLNMSPK